MSNISLFTIWSLNELDANLSLKQLIIKGYTINTKSTNVYIKIMSCLNKNSNIFHLDIEKQIISDPKFIEILETNLEGESHNDLLIRAIYETGKNYDMFRIKKLQKETAEREIAEKRKNAGLLLENTYDSNIDNICPLNVHDESSFYTINPKTGKRELLKEHHIFQYKGQCYNIDSIFRYIIEGGHINLDSHYIKRIFNKEGKIDYSNQGLTSEILKNKTYHKDIKVIDISNNVIDNLNGVHFPKTVNMLIIDNNPLGNNYFIDDSGGSIIILSMKNCGIITLDCKYLQKSIKHLDLRDNKDLTGLHSLGELSSLSKLDIRNTGIKKLDCSKFKSIGKNHHKLIIHCDAYINIKHDNFDWIEIIKE